MVLIRVEFLSKNKGKSIITNTINKGDIKGTESGGFMGKY